MKVGTDGVLLGAWAAVQPQDRRMLDIGTGTGLIALMLAQRAPEAHVTGVDIDDVGQARENAAASPWSGRVAFAQCPVQEFETPEPFDLIVSNPPFKMDFSDFRDALDSKENQQRFFAGIPKIKAKARDKMEIYQLFLQHIIFSLKPGGKAAVVVPTGFITAQSGIDKGIREHLVQNKMLAGVVSMPSNIFATTGTNVSILFIDASNKEKVVLIDASNLGEKVKDGKNQKTVLTECEEKRICEAFNNKWSEEDFSVVVSYDDIAAKNYSFSAGQYFDVKIEYTDMTPEQFAAKMKGFTENLNNLFEQSRELEVQIKMQMADIKYEI